MEDHELVARIMAKDEQAFEIFLDRYIKLFYSVAFKIIAPIASHEDIIDCLLESFTYIWFHMHLYSAEKYSFVTWCSLIILCRSKNCYTSIKRHNKKLNRLLSDRQTQLTIFPSAEETYFENQSYLNIIKTISSLPQPSRDIFIQRYILNRKPQIIAPAFDMNPKEIDRHLRKAKKILRKELKEYEIK